MAVNVGDLEATIRLLDKLSPELAKVEKNVSKFSASGSFLMGIFQGAGIAAFQAVQRAAFAAAGALAGFVKDSTMLAVAAVESESLFEVSFGSMADAARAWSEETSAALGLNAFEIRRQSGILFTMVSSMGVAKEAAFGMATGLTQLAADMSSFFDLPMEDAFNKLSAGISGEIEPLKRLGIVITETEKKSKALQMGYIKQGEVMTEAAKVQAFYQLVLEKTIVAQGDLARTIDSPANAMRILTAQFEQFQVHIGQAFIPSLQAVVKLLSEILVLVVQNKDAIKEFITEAILAMAQALTISVFALDEMVQWLVSFGRGINYAYLGIQLFVRSLQLMEEAKAAITNEDTIAGAMERFGQDSVAMTRGTRDMVASLDLLGEKSQNAATRVTDLIEAFRVGAKEAMKAGVASNTAAEEARRLAEEARLAAAAAIVEAQAMEDLNKQMDDDQHARMAFDAKELARELKAEAKAIDDATDAWEALDKEVLATEAAHEALLDGIARVDMEQQALKIERISTGLLQMGNLLGGVFGDLAPVLTAANGAFQNMGDEIEKNNAAMAKGEMSKADADAANLAAKISAVAQAAGMLGDMLSESTNPNLQKLGGALQGAAAGAQMGAAFGPWGAAIGAVGGAVVGLAKSWNAAEMAANDARDEFFETQGGFEAFSEKMAEVSDEDWAAKLFSAKTVEEFNAMVEEATGLLEAHQEALQLEADAWAGVEEAADKYGLTLEEMGPRFAAREISEQAGELFQDFQLLTAAGADLGAVLSKMGPAMSDLVNQSISAGVALPAAMEPMLQSAADAGTLFDANGVAITNLADSGITFAQTMDEMFTSLIEKIDAMVNALMGIGDVDVSPTIRIPNVDGNARRKADLSAQVGFFSPSMPTGPREGGGTDLRVHPGEAVSVTPAAANAGGGGGGADGQPLQVVVQIGNEKLYDMLTRATKTGQVRVYPSAVKSF